MDSQKELLELEIEREGEGMTRRVVACLKWLEKKFALHNGLAPWQQVWHDLRKLALALW